MSTVKQILRECHVFSTLGGAELEEVAGLAVEKQYEPGTVIFQEGDNAEELLILREGQVALQMTLSTAQPGMNRRITVDVINANDLIGWSAIVEPYVYRLAAVCLQRVTVLSFNGSKLRWIIRNNYKIGYEVLNELVRVVASRLDDARHVLVSERLYLLKPE